MEKKLSPYGEQRRESSEKALSTSSKKKQAPTKTHLTPAREALEKAKGDSSNSSGTQFFERERYADSYRRITKDEYLGIPESISGTSSFHCVHPEGKLYSERGLLKRYFVKELDPIAINREMYETCPTMLGWDLAKKLDFLICDPVAVTQTERMEEYLRDFTKISGDGFRIDTLNYVCAVIDFLVEHMNDNVKWRLYLSKLLSTTEKPIILMAASDVNAYFENITTYVGFMGYLLIRLDDEELFGLVGRGLLRQLSDRRREAGTARAHHVMSCAGPVLYQTVVRMISTCKRFKFSTFLELAFHLACYSVENCIEMMKENIIENLFYRFNPYFPNRELPSYDISPANPQDYNVILGDSSVNISTTLSLLLVLLKTTMEYLDKNPEFRALLPCPNSYSQSEANYVVGVRMSKNYLRMIPKVGPKEPRTLKRCFIWAYRYECRARGHGHERTTLTVIISATLKCFGRKLELFSSILMPDILSLAVLTELPPRSDWTRTVKINTMQLDVQFKKNLICLGVQFIKTFPCNIFMVEDRLWLQGLMYLIDPGLCHLRAPWPASLFAELRKIALQGLVCVLPLTAPRLAVEYRLTRRLMWYIEWYSESPYELPVLYWCVRLLHVIIENTGMKQKESTLRDLFDTHGVIIVVNLCYALLNQKLPPVEKAQAIIALNLQLLTKAVGLNRRVTCIVYPNIKWPVCCNVLAKEMLDVVMGSLGNNYIISDRLMVALLNFIWEAVIWNPQYRSLFISSNGMYKLLDIVTMTRAAVQCIALAMICDIARAGEAVGQLITWRANVCASYAHPNTVKRGASIATLLAAIFRDECKTSGVRLDEYGIIQDLDCPLMSTSMREALKSPVYEESISQRSPVCLSAGDLCGSRLSKAFAILHLLSDDLEFHVSLADESYNLYKNIKIAPEDETILILCSHYLTVKLNEAWLETKIQCPAVLSQDKETLEEFLQISEGWAKEIKLQQEAVIERHMKKEKAEECSLYSLLARVRLNIALDALRVVACAARSGDRSCLTAALIHEAVLAHHRLTASTRKLDAPILRTYRPMLDDQGLTGQNVKVQSIIPKNTS